MTKYEYLIVSIDEQGNYRTDEYTDVPPDDLDRHGHRQYRWQSINELGELGWQLVTIAFVSDSEAMGFFMRIAPIDIDEDWTAKKHNDAILAQIDNIRKRVPFGESDAALISSLQDDMYNEQEQEHGR